MKLKLLGISIAVQAALASAASIASRQTAEWPYGPFKTEGRQIVNANGDPVILVGSK